MKLLLDQGLPRSAGALLRKAGLDALHTAECGLATASDAAIIGYARQDERIVITLDADFHALIALSGATAPSVVRIRIQGLRADTLSDLVRHVVQECREDLLVGALVSVEADRVRVRKLPIQRPRHPK